jgi:NAD(P)-dependent dehydrogenase (short-subunit alcohol dehydrogenase family)
LNRSTSRGGRGVGGYAVVITVSLFTRANQRSRLHSRPFLSLFSAFPSIKNLLLSRAIYRFSSYKRCKPIILEKRFICARAVTKVLSTQEPAPYRGRHGEERSLGRGCIVNLGSALSYAAAPSMMAYVASKHALMGITNVAGKLASRLGCYILTLLKLWTMQNTKSEPMLCVHHG